MELDELKHVWKQQSSRDMDYSRSELMMLINNKMISLEEKIRSRDRLEIIACIILIVSYSIIFFTTNSAWKQAGSITIILSGILIWYKLKSVQRQSFSKDDPSPDRPMREYLHLEAQSIKKQKNLLKSVVWWYILPIGIGLFLFTMGFDAGLTTKIVYLAIVVLLGIGVWWMNQQAVKQKFNPLLQEIENAIEFVEE